MGQTLANADAALKEDYQPGAREELNNDIPFLTQVERNTRDIEGRRAVLALHVRRNAGVGARAEGGTLPTAGQQRYALERVPLKYNYGRILLTGPVIRQMASDRGAFVRQVDGEMRGVVADLKREVSRQLWLAGDGKIATAGVTTNLTVVVLSLRTTLVQMRYFAQGDRIDIGTVANPVAAALGLTVLSVNVLRRQLTVDRRVTTLAAQFVFRAGNNTANATAEVTGMSKIVAASGTLHNVDPTREQVWTSTVNLNRGLLRTLSEPLMASVTMAVQIASGRWPRMIICSDGVFRSYGAILSSQKRYPDTLALHGGYETLDFRSGGPNIPVGWDRDCPANSMFLVNFDQLAEYRCADWLFMDEDGAILSRVSGRDAYEATLFMYHELATDERNSHGLIKDLTEVA